MNYYFTKVNKVYYPIYKNSDNSYSIGLPSGEIRPLNNCDQTSSIIKTITSNIKKGNITHVDTYVQQRRGV